MPEGGDPVTLESPSVPEPAVAGEPRPVESAAVPVTGAPARAARRERRGAG